MQVMVQAKPATPVQCVSINDKANGTAYSVIDRTINARTSFLPTARPARPQRTSASTQENPEKCSKCRHVYPASRTHHGVLKGCGPRDVPRCARWRLSTRPEER